MSFENSRHLQYDFYGSFHWERTQKYQSKTICEHKNVSYDAQLRPIIVKSPSAPSAQATHQIANRHYEEVKSSCPDSQTLNSLTAIGARERQLFYELHSIVVFRQIFVRC